jgi:hypothetical protein
MANELPVLANPPFYLASSLNIFSIKARPSRTEELSLPTGRIRVWRFNRGIKTT